MHFFLHFVLVFNAGSCLQEDFTHVQHWWRFATAEGQLNQWRTRTGVCHQFIWPLCFSKHHIVCCGFINYGHWFFESVKFPVLKIRDFETKVSSIKSFCVLTLLRYPWKLMYNEPWGNHSIWIWKNCFKFYTYIVHT